MMYVPTGCFAMGDSNGLPSESPVHQVCLSAFWISQMEITNHQYQLCVNAGVCSAPTVGTHFGDPAYDYYPVVALTWDQAQQYAGWAGGSLPTEAQWEYAARGPESWAYAWGNQFDGTRLNYCDTNCPLDWRDTTTNDGYADLSPVGTYPRGASWVGALDMTGNVWEWVYDWYDPGYYATQQGSPVDPTGPANPTGSRVLKGGSFTDEPKNLRAAFRYFHEPGSVGGNQGFRIVMSEPLLKGAPPPPTPTPGG
jgi:formylglycine-generating enzyme required for sulfatase activity